MLVLIYSNVVCKRWRRFYTFWFILVDNQRLLWPILCISGQDHRHSIEVSFWGYRKRKPLILFIKITNYMHIQIIFYFINWTLRPSRSPHFSILIFVFASDFTSIKSKSEYFVLRMLATKIVCLNVTLMWTNILN